MVPQAPTAPAAAASSSSRRRSSSAQSRSGASSSRQVHDDPADDHSMAPQAATAPAAHAASSRGRRGPSARSRSRTSSSRQAASSEPVAPRSRSGRRSSSRSAADGASSSEAVVDRSEGQVLPVGPDIHEVQIEPGTVTEWTQVPSGSTFYCRCVEGALSCRSRTHDSNLVAGVVNPGILLILEAECTFQWENMSRTETAWVKLYGLSRHR